MKRSLFIAIAVLLMAALFVGCNADKVQEDQLFEVTIEGEARALSAAGTSVISVDDLDWYYTATKTSGYFKTGEHKTLTPIEKTTAGLSGSKIGDEYGKMSSGGWLFCFYGYVAGTTPASDPKSNAVYYQENLRKTITGNVALEISLTRGAAEITPVAKFTQDGLFWLYDASNFIGTITLEISKGSEKVAEYVGTVVDGAGKVEFKTLSDIELSIGQNALSFDVYSTYIDNGTTVKENLGKTLLTIVAESGMTYTITADVNGVDFYEGDVQYNVEIGDLNVPVIATETITYNSAAGTSTVATANTPAGDSTKQTTVVFSENMGGKNLTVETSSAEIASSKSFTVAADETAVASISLTLSEGNIGDGQTATITTYIGEGYTNPVVRYNGDGAQPVTLSYVDGYITFSTTHFSEFYVTIKGEAKIGSKVYKTLVEAIADAQDGAIVTLLKDTSGAGIFLGVADAKTITVDLGGFTYTCSGPAVGSSKTETQAWHLEKNNTVTIKNGTLTSTATAGVYMLVQNYCNLTLDDVTLDGTHLPGRGQYVLSGNNGDILITGETNITAKEGDFAFDVCYTNYYPDGVRYLFDDNYVGTVTGTIQLDVWGSKPAETKCKLTIKAGTFNGAFDIQSALQDEALNDIIILGGTFNGVVPVAFVNGAVYGSLMDAIDSVEKNATATIVLLNDVADGSGLSTDSRGADSYPKNLTIDFNGKTYTMKDPAVGSSNTQTQAMHWAIGSTIVMKNGTFAVQADAINVKMGMQNYAALTIEDMVIDLRAVAAGHYGNTYTGTNAKYNGLEMPIFNHNGTATGPMTLKNSTVLAGDINSFSVYTEGDLYLDNCTFNKPIALSSDGAPKAYVNRGTYEFAPYFAGDEVINAGDYYTVQTASN